MNNWCPTQDADLSKFLSNGVESDRLPQRNEPVLWARASEQHLFSVGYVMREIINVQVGQCGNQIGYKVVNLVVATKLPVAFFLLSVG